MPVRLSAYLKKAYGEKIYRLSLSSGCSCPNRDGTVKGADGAPSYRGCTFCSEGGSGEFAEVVYSPEAISQQLDRAKERIAAKTDARRFIAYFQSYTNTYGDPDRLFALYKEVIEREDIEILSIGTRPDCLGPEIMDMLVGLNAIKPVWVELGLQTIHESTAKHINRGYELSVFEDAYKRLKEAGITVIVHIILGLPGESENDMLETVRYLAALTPTLDGIKLQNLNILKGTVVAEEYDSYLQAPKESEYPFHIMSMEEYTDLIAKCLRLLPKSTVVHRMTGDGPRSILVEPLWVTDKKRVINMLSKKCGEIFEKDEEEMGNY